MKWEIYFLTIGQGFLCCFSSFCGFPMPFAHLFFTKSFIISSLTFRCFSILDSEPLSTFWLHCKYPLTSCCLACSWISFKNVFYRLICYIKWSINFCSKVCGFLFIQFRRNHFFYSEFRKISSIFLLCCLELLVFVLKYFINFWVILVHLKV